MKMCFFLQSKSRRYLIIALLITMALVVSGCAGESETNTVNIGEDVSDGSFALPGTIQSSAFNTDGEVLAFVTFSGVDDAGNVGESDRRKMGIVDGRAIFTKKDLRPGKYNVGIEFIFQFGGDNKSCESGTVILATSDSIEVELSSGSNESVEFQRNNYNYPDSDDDTFLNIVELEHDTDPCDGASRPDLVCTVVDGVINCVPNEFLISGRVIALESTLVLRNNGDSTDDVTITEGDDSFVFQNKLANGSEYSVEIVLGNIQDCGVVNGTGNVSGGDVNNITVVCLEIGGGFE